MRVLYFSRLGDDREGKSYGGPHLGSHGIVPAAVGVVPRHGSFGLVHIQGNVKTNFLLVAMSIKD